MDCGGTPLNRAARCLNSGSFYPNHPHREQDQARVVGDSEFEVAVVPEMFAGIAQQLARELHRFALCIMDGGKLEALVILHRPFGGKVGMEIEARHSATLTHEGPNRPLMRLGDADR